MADIKKMLHEIRERTLPEEKRFIRKNMAIVDTIHEIMERKSLNASSLAGKMGKSPAELSKWLSGSHNLTLQSLSKLEEALGEDIILTYREARQHNDFTAYTKMNVNANMNSAKKVNYNLHAGWSSNESQKRPSRKMVS